MAFAVKTTQFEGPLNVLLDLIESDDLDISEMSLANVTDSYIKYIEGHPEIPPEELTDFLVVASRLLLIKSKILLPFLHVGGEEEEQELESQLKIFRQYLDASKVVEKMIGRRRFLYVHEKLPKVDIGFSPPRKFSADQMEVLMRGVLRRLEPIVRIPRRKIFEKNVSIHDKISHIRSFIEKASSVSFRNILTTAESRTEIVVSFLALLELIKQRSVTVSQSGQFDDITITRLDNVPA